MYSDDIVIISYRLDYNNWNSWYFFTIFLVQANYLKYGFYKKSLWKDATLTSWTLFHHKRVPVSTTDTLLWWKKCSNWSELHLSEVTSYKIHTLIKLHNLILTPEYWNQLICIWLARKVTRYMKKKSVQAFKAHWS